jgi:DNA-nicking Smr family endonuclease
MKKLQVDVHGMTREEFQNYLGRLMEFTPRETRIIVVVHGYRNGHVLKDHIRYSFHDDRVESIEAYEEGRTILRLMH